MYFFDSNRNINKEEKQHVSKFEKEFIKLMDQVESTFSHIPKYYIKKINKLHEIIKNKYSEFLEKLRAAIRLYILIESQIDEDGYKNLKDDIKSQLKSLYEKHLKLSSKLAKEVEELKIHENKIDFENEHVANLLIKEVEDFEKNLENILVYDKIVVRKAISLNSKTSYKDNLNKMMWASFRKRKKIINHVLKLCVKLVKSITGMEIKRINNEKELKGIFNSIINRYNNLFQLGTKLMSSVLRIRTRSAYRKISNKYPEITTVVVDVDECLIDTTGIKDLAIKKYKHGNEIYKILEKNTNSGALSFDEAIRIMYRLLEGFTTVRDYYDALKKAEELGLVNMDLLEICKKWKSEGKEVILATRSNLEYIKPLAAKYGLDNPVGVETQRYKGYVLNTNKIIGLFNWRDKHTSYTEKMPELGKEKKFCT